MPEMTHSRLACVFALVALFAVTAQAGEPQAVRVEVPAWLPRYDVDFDLDLARQQLTGHIRATWFNHYERPVRELVFNAHSRYVVPDAEIGFDAKMLEILRMNPGECLGVHEPVFYVDRITLAGGKDELPFRYEGDTKTALVVPLPAAVKPGASVSIDMAFTFKLPEKQGRWGRWHGVTTLSNWLPVFAVFDDSKLEQPDPNGPGALPYSACWQPTPFIPWHQPFYNDAGVYHVRATLPAEQKVATSGSVVASKDLGDGRQQLDIVADGVRDFAFLCSDRYQCFEGVIPEQEGVPAPVRVRVLAFPEHEHYAKEFVRIASEAITAYSQWFGPYPYPDFTVAESFFGWNGNECGTLVMIDERVFAMPHVAGNYVDYLLSHEVCHQWWYNLVGTNGYCETWMDEALATHFSNKLQNQKHGHDSTLMTYPRGLEWAPNIRREDYRSYSLLGAIGRGENCPVVQDIPKFGHLANLFSMCYDKGAKIVGTIEERLGEDNFRCFMRHIMKKYRYRILRVADYQRELEEYTGDANGEWNKFFKGWLYGVGLCDWAVKDVIVHDRICATCPGWVPRKPLHLVEGKGKTEYPVHVTVILRQCGEVTERTTLGFMMPGCAGYAIRVPIVPEGGPYRLDEPPCEVFPQEDNVVRVEVQLPLEPEQIAVDPDQILVDKNPANNFWKPAVHWRVTPLYTFLDETDLTTRYDSWNVIVGPWLYGTAYDDAWYTRSTMFGFRAGLYRTQEFNGGVYAAYRTNFRDVVVGADGLLDHWPCSPIQLGYNVEQRLHAFEDSENQAFRAAGFARYVFTPSDSLYLPPMHYVETFLSYQDNFYPYATQATLNGIRPEHISTAGLHYHIDYRTPYWDPAGGFMFDATYQGGVGDLNGVQQGVNLFTAQGSYVTSFPDLRGKVDALDHLCSPVLSWLADTRVAVRGYGAIGLPNEGMFFVLGGSELLRGFDLAQRQGNAVWVGSVEWRVPLARDLSYDCIDHIIGLRNVYGAVFYDVGNAYTGSQSAGPIAHSVGVGLRLDVAWFSFVERTTLRFDMAKTLNTDTGPQFWLGIGYPF
jgi:hypothetical protein